METATSPATARLSGYLRGLTRRLDPGAGWYGEFLRRDPEGLRACLEGEALPPWDVVESLLADLEAASGAGIAAREVRYAAWLRAEAAAEWDRLPGGAEELRAHVAAAAAQRTACEAALHALTARLAGAADRTEAAALASEHAWLRDDTARAASRHADLTARLAALAPAPGPAHPADALPAVPAQPYARPPASGGGGGEGQGRPARSEPARGGEPAPDRTPPAPPTAVQPGHSPLGGAAPHPPPAPVQGAHPASDEAPDPGLYGAGRPGGTGSAGVPPAGTARRAPAAHPADPPQAGPARQAPRGAEDADRSAEGGFPGGAPAAGDTEPDGGAGSAVAPPSRRRARKAGGARYAGAAAAEDAPPTGVPYDAGPVPAPAPAPRGARFAGASEAAAADPAATDPAAAGAAARPVAAPSSAASGTAPAAGPVVGPGAADGPAADIGWTVRELAGLRGAGRGGEAYALLCAAAGWPPERLPALADALGRAGLGADWATLLWEAAALPPERLAAVAAALGAAGRHADCAALLRQGVARPAADIAQAATALLDAGREREADAVLEAFVRARTAEDAARTARRDPDRLVPRLLRAAEAVSAGHRRDLVHALRVAKLPDS
ncbi:hypothetical protein C0216_09840 [Streptomyces globosus]|uniref:UL36 very large tegument protein n=1 Tax=Streptomyces globosus TaxID=68209 RepID=A0A344TYK5_9ACTN|nr:hypothetical protein [Streptomyces globosus]AXE23726.1 hypothetical protein C0216_09840 [Streptomyces globosus]